MNRDSQESDLLAIAMDPDMVVPKRIAYWAEREPDRLFIQESGGRSVTYLEFYEEMKRWCGYLDRLGLKQGDRVASLLPGSIDAYLLWMASACLGILEISVNRELRGNFLRHAIDDARCEFSFVREEDENLLAQNDVACPNVVVVSRQGSPAANADPLEITRWPQPSDISCVIYTSGTTGPSKGVLIPWAQLSSIIDRLPREYLSERDVFYTPWPIFHVTARTPVVTAVDMGTPLVLREKLSVSDFWHDVDTYGCTCCTVGTAIPILLSNPPSEQDRQHPLRFGYGAGASVKNVDFQERFGVKMLLCYGSTEIGFPIVNLDIDRDNIGSSGKLRAGYQARIVDSDGNDVPKGESGELWIKPPGRDLMLRGYMDLPEKTAEVIEDGWYKTGDALYIGEDDGFYFVDRMKDTIRRKGENISSSAYEADLLHLPEIIECAAVKLPSEISGAEILLVVSHRDGRNGDPEALFEQLVPRYPKYMLPSFIKIVEDFPRTQTNKIRKQELIEGFKPEECWQTPAADARQVRKA